MEGEYAQGSDLTVVCAGGLAAGRGDGVRPQHPRPNRGFVYVAWDHPVYVALVSDASGVRALSLVDAVPLAPIKEAEAIKPVKLLGPLLYVVNSFH